MVRADLIKLLAAQYPDLPARNIEATVSAFFDAITAHLADGGRVEIRGFGTFTTRARDPRTGRNPGTGETVLVDAKRVPRFRSGGILSKLVDESRSQV